MGGSLSWTDGLGEADATDARITLGQRQSFDVQPPLFAADLLHRVEQAGAAEQDLFMVAQALADRLGDLLAQHLELLWAARSSLARRLCQTTSCTSSVNTSMPGRYRFAG